jgi:aminopeptidase
MTDHRLRKLAEILVRYCVKALPGDRVGIMPHGSVASSVSLQSEVLREVLKAGATPHPYIIPMAAEEFDYVFFSTASDAQLQRLDRIYEVVAKEFDCDITIMCETNTKRLSQVDSERQAMSARAHSGLLHEYMSRAAKGELRWVLTAFPTSAYAQDAEMSVEEFSDFVFSSTYADTEDPIFHWEALGRKQKALVDWLVGRKNVRVNSNHIEMSFSIEGRAFINCDGRVNMPDGEIFTGPVEGSVNGWLESTFPAISHGVDVGRVTLRFEDGVVVRADAERNQPHLDKLLATDQGASRVGEFGIGTNSGIQLFTKNMLFDEKIGGTIHVALGEAYPQTGATNESGIHWDFLCDMRDGGQIDVDGQRFYDSGTFLV